ncbi:arylsulfatase [bacterium]|nr:arylsulfatase [bacterium]
MNRPNILLILNDDMGFSDLGCYGGEVQTPNLDCLAERGLRFTQFYNTARCCPSRASLLTGLHPHQANVGHMMDDDGVDGYRGDLASNTATIAEVLKGAGYATYMSGKWHITRHNDGPKHSWPRQRGFDRFFGTITGAGSFYNPNTLTRENERIDVEDEGEDFFYTDAISDQAVDYINDHARERKQMPFFGYVAYTAPHWPLHAHEEDIAKYRGRFDRGWDRLRQERLERMVEMGLIDPSWQLTERDPTQPPWEEAEHRDWQARRMEVYAAQIDRLDQGVGRIVGALEQTGQLDNTLILFMADNGGCAEEIGEAWSRNIVGSISRRQTRAGCPVQHGNDPGVMPGPEDTYQSYGVPWANVSNTPFREYKHWVHEGGIATPLIAHWPQGIADQGALRTQPAQLPDVMATCIEVAGAAYPIEREGHAVQPLEGYSMAPIFRGEPHGREVLYWEHEGNCAVRKGRWKMVCKYPGGWELYDIEKDRTELNDVSGEHPELVQELSRLYEAWAKRCNVMPWAELQEMRRKVRDGE